MEKKGQATLFIILGIIVVALVVLFFYARGSIYVPPTQEGLSAEMGQIEDHVYDCLTDIGEDYIEQIGLQGGYLATPEDTYVLWDDTTVSYLCYNQEGLPYCTNRMLTLVSMETELQDAIEQALSTCINVFQFGGVVETYEVVAPEGFTLDVDIEDSVVKLLLTYPVMLVSKDGDVTVEEDIFAGNVNAPLGELYSVAMEVLDYETEFGEFDQLSYVLTKQGEYTIYKHRPYPDKIYELKLRENDYIFRFAVQGESLT
ncbi:MAG: hypothetical protein ABIF40_05305 [archaeon]